MAKRKRWSELTPGQQRSIIVMSAVEVVLTTVALVDLARRPGDQVRGPKTLWALGCFIQPVGPVTYLTVGRRRGVGSSRVDLQACKLEYSIVSPK